jgi:hypothetical protein
MRHLRQVAPNEEIMSEETMPSQLGNDPNRHAILRVSTHEQILHKEFFALEMLKETVEQRIEGVWLQGLVHRAPRNVMFDSGVSNQKSIPWRSAGMSSCANDDRSSLGRLSLVAPDDLLIEGRYREVPVDLSRVLNPMLLEHSLDR